MKNQLLKIVFFCLCWMLLIQHDGAANFSFPTDPSVLDVKRDFNAIGDGIADDSDALQKAIDASCGNDAAHRGKSNVVYLPNGTYRVTRALVVKAALGPWLYGQSRDGVVIKLDDHAVGVTSVLRTHPNEVGPTSADWFMRNLRHFTIDVGNNPETDGIRYYATNTGCLQDVRVVGNGNIGINAGFLGQSGPNLIQQVEIEGFETGISSQWIWSQTLSQIKIHRCRKHGLYVSANVVAVEDLTVSDTPQPIYIDLPQDWGHWSGVAAITGAKLDAGNTRGESAIYNRGVLYARDLQTQGFATAVRTEGRDEQPQTAVEEYFWPQRHQLFEDSKAGSLKLPIQQAPTHPWELQHDRWLCVDDFGVKANDNEDDSNAMELALVAAAKQGKTVAYFRGCGGPEPNWFILSRPIRIPAPVHTVMGLGWGRLIGQKEGGFVVDDDSAAVVKFQNLDSFGGSPIQLINASAEKTMCVESCGVKVIGEGHGGIFVTDCSGSIDLRKPSQNCWTRQLNPEGESNDGLVKNRGANLWCLGVKHEGKGVRFATSHHGKTEIIGLFNYGGTNEELDPRPSFDISNAMFSVVAAREIAFDQHTALNKVREQRGAEVRLYDKYRPGAGGWTGWSLYSGAPSSDDD